MIFFLAEKEERVESARGQTDALLNVKLKHKWQFILKYLNLPMR